MVEMLGKGGDAACFVVDGDLGGRHFGGGGDEDGSAVFVAVEEQGRWGDASDAGLGERLRGWRRVAQVRGRASIATSVKSLSASRFLRMARRTRIGVVVGGSEVSTSLSLA